MGPRCRRRFRLRNRRVVHPDNPPDTLRRDFRIHRRFRLRKRVAQDRLRNLPDKFRGLPYRCRTRPRRMERHLGPESTLRTPRWPVPHTRNPNFRNSRMDRSDTPALRIPDSGDNPVPGSLHSTEARGGSLPGMSADFPPGRTRHFRSFPRWVRPVRASTLRTLPQQFRRTDHRT